MKMRPIPRRLLPHSVQLKTPGALDTWQQPAYALRNLLHVRMEPSDKIIAGNDNTQRQLVCTLFFDCRNSVPRGTEFSVGQKVVWEKREMTVVTVDRLYDGQTLHHWEVGLE